MLWVCRSLYLNSWETEAPRCWQNQEHSFPGWIFPSTFAAAHGKECSRTTPRKRRGAEVSGWALFLYLIFLFFQGILAPQRLSLEQCLREGETWVHAMPEHNSNCFARCNIFPRLISNPSWSWEENPLAQALWWDQ